MAWTKAAEAANVAVTTLGTSIRGEQAPWPEQAPPQAWRPQVQPGVGVACKVTVLPVTNGDEQEPGQSMPGGEETTLRRR